MLVYIYIYIFLKSKFTVNKCGTGKGMLMWTIIIFYNIIINLLLWITGGSKNVAEIVLVF